MARRSRPEWFALEALPGRLLALAFLGTLYFAAGKLGLGLAFVNASASPVWPPTGIALAAFLVVGYRVWPAILIGAFLVNLTTAGSAVTSAVIALGNTLEGLLGAFLVNRFAGGRSAFDRPRDILRFLLLAAGIATTVSATIGVTTLSLGGFARWEEFGPIWLTWWLGDATGALVVAPMLVLWAGEPWPPWNPSKAAEAGVLLVGLIATALFVFVRVGPALPGMLCIPFPLWAAFRFGRREAATTTFLLSALAIWGTLRGAGPFVRVSQNDSLLVLQAFMAVLSATTLAAGAVVAQRNRVEQALRSAGEELERRVAERTKSLRASEDQIRRMNLELEARVRERTGELERSNEALRQFAYAAGHDLQEPLRTVANSAQRLARGYRGRLDADADEFIGFIVDGAEWMHQLLRDLLAYSRVEMTPLAMEPTDFNVALDHALENLRAAIVESAAHIDRGPLPVAPADEVQAVQLLQNLVGNAIKFRRPGLRPHVHVEAATGDAEWLFSVRDNGIGIDHGQAERIFGIFQRLHLREEYPGTGVGLAICRKIVERHGGRIWVESIPDGGCAFHFTLPRASREVP